MDDAGLTVSACGDLSDEELSVLHAAAFGSDVEPTPWNERLRRHSVCWVTARAGAELVGFVNVIGDGGAHAVLLDTCVHPAWQGRGVGRALVAAAAGEAAAHGCQWLHADYEEQHIGFYEEVCGLRPTAAGLLRLDDQGTPG